MKLRERERGRRKVMVVEVEISEETLEVVNSLKLFGSCFRKDGEQQEDVKMRVGEGLKTFGARKMFNVGSISPGVKRELYEGGVTPTMTHGAGTWGMRIDGRKLHVMKDKVLRSVCIVTRMDG